MHYNQYARLPSVGRSLPYVFSATLLLLLFIFMVNPESLLSNEMKRAFNRGGASLLLIGGILGFVSVLSNKTKTALYEEAQHNIESYTASINTLSAQNNSAVQKTLKELQDFLRDAEKVKHEATNFETITVFRITVAALIFLMAGTLMLIVAA